MKTFEERLEAAARELCVIMNSDPDDNVRYTIPGDMTLNMKYRPLWKNVADELKREIHRGRISLLIQKWDLL